MNKRQEIAYKNPCYIPKDADNPLLFGTEEFGELLLTSILKIGCYFDNDVWNAVILVHDRKDRQLSEKDLSVRQVKALKAKITELLEGVGKDEIVFVKEESDFEALRALNPREKKNLKQPNLFEIFEIKKLQQFALENPYPSMMDMLKRKFTKTVQFGGMMFSTILTITETPEGIKWHASCAIKDEKQKPIKIFELPAGHAEMQITIVSKLLQNIGTGQKVTRPFDKNADIFDCYKNLSPAEIKMLPKSKQADPFILRKALDFFVNAGRAR